MRYSASIVERRQALLWSFSLAGRWQDSGLRPYPVIALPIGAAEPRGPQAQAPSDRAPAESRTFKASVARYAFRFDLPVASPALAF
jgi:hypothetical protein